VGWCSFSYGGTSFGKAGKVSYVLFRSGMLGRGMAGEAC